MIMQTNWVLLTDTRQRILRYWNIAAFVLLVFLFIQQSTGLIEGALLEVWRWYFVAILPGFMLLHYSAWTRRRTDRIINRAAHRSVYWLSVAYVGMLFITFFLSRAAIDHNDYGFSAYFTRSLWIVLPFNLILCSGYWLLFYKQEPLFKPSSAVLMEVASHKAAAARNTKNEAQYACYEAVRNNNFGALFLLMEKAYNEQRFSDFDSMLHLQSHYNALKKEIELQVITETDARIQLNRITVGLIDLIGEVKS